MLLEALEALRNALAGVPGFVTVASTPYFFRPFLLLVTLGMTAGLVGTIVNLRRVEFNAEAMVHSVFPGIVGGALWGGLEGILPGAALVSILVVAALTWTMRSGGASESATAVVLTSFFAVGIVLSLRVGDSSGQLEALMFGRMLEVTDARLLQALAACSVGMVLAALTWRAQVFVAFDPDGARACGIRVTLVDLALNTAIAAVVVSAASAVGVLLVIGYMVVPGAAARLLSSSPRTMALLAILAGVAGGWLGLWLATLPSARLVSPQASVALMVLASFPVALAAQQILQFIRRRGRSHARPTTPRAEEALSA
ncbi:metal ABC transporter permease [Schaalia sp. 19OD2882]|nr:metal ABC transporter permease [Schaalia sp. 19OD2882]